MSDGTGRFEVSRVPDQMMPAGVVREGVSEGPTYEGLMEVLRRVEAQPYGPLGAAPDDWFEGVRGEGETRGQTKSRVMLEEMSQRGFPIRDADLWKLRAAYVRVYQFVQGYGQGLPYNTHNWAHFYNRYGSGRAKDPVYMIGLRVDTVEEMGRAGMIESQSRETLRLLGHWQRH